MKKITFWLFILLTTIQTNAQFGCGSAVVISNGYTATGITTPGNGGPEDWNVNPTGTSINASYWDDDVYLFQYTAGSITESISITIESVNSWNGAGIFTTCSDNTFSGELAAIGTTGANSTKTLNATVAANQTVYIAVGQWGTPNGLNFSVTNFTATPITLPPNCTVLSNPANEALNFSGSIVSWTAASGNPTGYNLRIGSTPGGTDVVNNIDVGNVLSYNVGVLDVSTTYFATVTPYNSNGPAASPCDETNFTTCDEFGNFSENFDALTASGQLPSCWSRVISGGAGTPSVGANTINNSPPYSLALTNSSSTATANIMLVSPYLNNLASGTNRLKFFARNTVATQDLEVGTMSNPSDPSTFTVLQAVDITTAFQEYSVSFSEYAGTDNFIAIRRLSTSTFSTVYLDNIVWEEIPATAPSCVLVSNPANNATNVSIETAISWASNADATGYFIKIGTTLDGDDFLANTDLGNVLTYTPSTLLEYSTDYFVTITPYNSNGVATCTASTFTTRDAPITGSICADPIIISQSSLPYTTTDNTNLYGDDYSTSICSNNYMGGDEVIYTFTPTTTTSINIVLSNLGGTWSGIHVLNGCPNTATTCHAFVGNSGTTDRVINDFAVTAGETYFIVISTYPAPQSVSYTLTITENTCTNPTATFSRTNNCPTETFNVVTNISNLGSATSLTLTDNQGSAAQTVTATGDVTFGPYAFGTSVVITVANDQDATCVVTSPAQTITACPPANDECSGAIALTVNSDLSCTTVTPGTIAAATASNVDPAACSGTENDDVWFSFVATGTTHNIQLTSVTGSTTDLYHSLWTGADCGNLALVPGTCSDPNTSNPTGLTIGQTYYLRVYSWANAVHNSTFNVCIGSFPPPPANDECSGAIALTVNSDFSCASQTPGTIAGATASTVDAAACGGTENDDVWFSFVATSTSHRIQLNNVVGSTSDLYHSLWTGADCGTLTLVPGTCSDPNTSNPSGLTIGTTYYVRVYSFANAIHTSTFNICIGTPPAPPVNDACANAIVVTNFPYNNTQDASAATNNGGFISACTGGMNDGVWYSVTGNGADITVALTAVVGWDPEIGVYTGSCGNFTCVGNADAGLSGAGETYTIVNSVEGTTYYINIGNWSGTSNNSEGSFTIDITTTLSSDSFNNNNFSAYPNPVKDILNLAYTSEISDVRVVNMLGQVVLTKKLNANNGQLDVSQLSAGTYIVNVTIGDTVKTIKVVKQ